ncbi:MAG: metal ABC transporter solute-binding protein, Zn/Mn family [Desulfamplus sp.]
MKYITNKAVQAFLLLSFILFLVLSPIFSTVQASGSEGKDKISDKKIPVFVTILPQKFFVEQIGKDRVDVQAMVEPGASPHTYEPKPQQMTALSKAKIYFTVGLPFEKVWLDKISDSNKDMKIVHTDEGIDKIYMVSHSHHKDDAEHKAEKSHLDSDTHAGEEGEPDPHVWLSPKLVSMQAKKIVDGLKEIDPDFSAQYDENYKAFISEIFKLDQELKSIFTGRNGVQFMVFHPSWGYFARDYNLQEIPVEIEGKTPKPAQLKELISHAREHKISVVFAQPQFSVKSAQQIAKEIDGEVLFADPLAYDWFKNLRDVAAKFRSALK